MAVNPIEPVPPVVLVAASPPILWPPNGRIQDVVVSGVTVDNLGGSGVNPATLRYQVLDEYGQVQPAGAVPLSDLRPIPFLGQTAYAFSFTVPLQVSRLGTDRDGRQYAILVTDRDNAGNAGIGGTLVTVPHDMGQHNGQGGNSNGNGGGGVIAGPSQGGGDQGDQGDQGGHGHGHGHGQGHGHGHGGD